MRFGHQGNACDMKVGWIWNPADGCFEWHGGCCGGSCICCRERENGSWYCGVLHSEVTAEAVDEVGFVARGSRGSAVPARDSRA
jgi:hypothetical protein